MQRNYPGQFSATLPDVPEDFLLFFLNSRSNGCFKGCTEHRELLQKNLTDRKLLSATGLSAIDSRIRNYQLPCSQDNCGMLLLLKLEQM